MNLEKFNGVKSNELSPLEWCELVDHRIYFVGPGNLMDDVEFTAITISRVSAGYHSKNTLNIIIYGENNIKYRMNAGYIIFTNKDSAIAYYEVMFKSIEG